MRNWAAVAECSIKFGLGSHKYLNPCVSSHFVRTDLHIHTQVNLGIFAILCGVPELHALFRLASVRRFFEGSSLASQGSGASPT